MCKSKEQNWKMCEKQIELKGEIDKGTITVDNFCSPQLTEQPDKKPYQQTSKDMEKLNNAVNQQG